MTKRWRVVLELTFDVDPEQDVVKYQGDVEADIASRALARVRPALNEVVGQDKPFAHYHILEQPRRVYD